MIPAKEKFFYPILQFIEDGKQHSLAGQRDLCAEYFKLDENGMAEKIKSGQSRSYDRVQWTMAYFYQAKLVDRIRRGLYVITTEGKKLAKSGETNLSVNYLKEHYPSFKEISLRSNKPAGNKDNSKSTSASTEPETSDDLKTTLDITLCVEGAVLPVSEETITPYAEQAPAAPEVAGEPEVDIDVDDDDVNDGEEKDLFEKLYK